MRPPATSAALRTILENCKEIDLPLLPERPVGPVQTNILYRQVLTRAFGKPYAFGIVSGARKWETLGDVLYAKKAKAPASEKDWVALIQSIANGDQLALHALFARTQRIVFTLSMRITRNRETAEEVTLDVFHDVWRRASTYDPEGGSVVGWVLNQARSRAIDRVRYEQRKKRTKPETAVLVGISTESDPHEALDLSEQTRLLRVALQVLTPEERQAIETAFFSELTYHETAATLNQPLGTVKTRIRSGLRKLREALGGTSTP